MTTSYAQTRVSPFVLKMMVSSWNQIPSPPSNGVIAGTCIRVGIPIVSWGSGTACQVTLPLPSTWSANKRLKSWSATRRQRAVSGSSGAAAETTTGHDPQEGLWSVKKVFIWLAILTVAEVGVVYLEFIPKMGIAALLVLGAIWKAALVAMFFMHLKVEKKVILWMLLATSVLAAIFVLGLVPDMVMGPGAGGAAGG